MYARTRSLSADWFDGSDSIEKTQFETMRRFLCVRRMRNETEVYLYKVPVARALNDSCKRYQSSFAGRAIVFGHFFPSRRVAQIFLRNETAGKRADDKLVDRLEGER